MARASAEPAAASEHALTRDTRRQEVAGDLLSVPPSLRAPSAGCDDAAKVIELAAAAAGDTNVAAAPCGGCSPWLTPSAACSSTCASGTPVPPNLTARRCCCCWRRRALGPDWSRCGVHSALLLLPSALLQAGSSQWPLPGVAAPRAAGVTAAVHRVACSTAWAKALSCKQHESNKRNAIWKCLREGHPTPRKSRQGACPLRSSSTSVPPNPALTHLRVSLCQLRRQH